MLFSKTPDKGLMTFQGKIRGVHLTRVVKYVKKKRGSLGLNKFLENVSKRLELDRDITPDFFEEKEWYPYDGYLNLLEEADAMLGNGDGHVAYDIGLSTIKDLGILSYLARKPVLDDFLASGQKNWNQVYDFGKVDIKKSNETTFLIRYNGFPDSNVRCQYFQGSLEGMMEICGLSGTVEETSHNHADGYCEYTLKWE